MRSMAAESLFWRQTSDGAVLCTLCPHACKLAEGVWGHCRARRNVGGRMALPYYADISSIAIDPVEKKPLRQFMPGSKTYSVGFWHCDMDCPFCQNWEIAHPVREARTEISPERLIEMALDTRCPSISFTYSEPSIHIEYVLEAMRRARSKGLKTILVTNGNLLPEPARAVLAYTDATNVDFKSADPKLYRALLGGNLSAVREFIRIAHEFCHVEITSLAVPGVLDSPKAIETISKYLSEISEDIPLHITSYHPAWHYHASPLPASTLSAMREAALRHLRHVYTYF